MFKATVCFSLFVCIVSCSRLAYWSGTKIKKADYTVNIMKEEYFRDSAFLCFTAYEYEKIKFNDPMFNHEDPKIFVDTIIYSPDKLKMFTFLIIKHIDNSNWAKDNYPKQKYFYGGVCLIGYRNRLDTMWTVYDFNWYSTDGWSKYIQVKRLFNYFYFYEFKGNIEYSWDSIKQVDVEEKIGYNLNEADFWTKSIVWRKGARIPGLYNFQIYGNVKPSDADYGRNLEKKMPVINYPDSILKLYK
jgi:hypothetical protein